MNDTKTRYTGPSTREGVAYFIAFMLSIVLANWLIEHWGTIRYDDGPWLIPVWPGALTSSGNTILAPSGVIAVGLGFTLRDLVQRRLGWRASFIAIIFGALASGMISLQLAFASGFTFLLSESLDLAVYTPLQRKHLIGAIVGSNLVAVIVDSVVFLTLAFGSLDHIDGQIIGKAWMTLLAIPIIIAIRAHDRARGIMTYDAYRKRYLG